MSWDIHFQDFPDVASMGDIPENFVPQPIGTRSDVIAKIKSEFPQADFTDPSWGLIEGDGWSIEVNIGDDEDCESFMLHVRGGGDAIDAVARIAAASGVRGIDMQTSEFFTPDAAIKSFGVWQDYRDRVIASDVSSPVAPKKQGFFSRIFGRD